MASVAENGLTIAEATLAMLVRVEAVLMAEI